jgi:hypothetical protein
MSNKRVHLDQSSPWKVCTVPFLPGIEDPDDVTKSLKNLTAFAKSLPIPGWSQAQKVAAVQEAHRLGYLQITEDGDNLALEFLFPDPDATHTQPDGK